MAAPTAAARQQELERRFLASQARKSSNKKHVAQLSISDPSHHVTEAIYSGYYDDEPSNLPTSPVPTSSAGTADGSGSGIGSLEQPSLDRDNRPLSYMNSPSERESFETRRARRHGTLIDSPPSNPTSPLGGPTTTRTPLARTRSNERLPSPTTGSSGSLSSPKSLQRMSSLGSENIKSPSAASPPSLTRQLSNDPAVQSFPLNDIDYESSPEAVKQELSNLHALRRMSMNIDAADPDLPSFNNIPTVAPKHSDDEDDPSKLFWVPASLHPELAPKEFKTFIEDRVERIRRRSGGEDSLSPDGLERSGSGGSTGSGSSSLRRKKSMLSHQIDTKGTYEDGAERLERKRSKGMQFEGQATVANLSDLETLVSDPAQLVRRMSLDNARTSSDSFEGRSSEDMPILPPVGTLKRSTRTTYRRGSLKKGERVPFSRRAQQRHGGSESEETPITSSPEPPSLGLTRVQTEPAPPPSESGEHLSQHSANRANNKLGTSRSSEDLATDPERRETMSPPPATQDEAEQDSYQDGDRPPSYPPGSSQQPKQFQSRIASAGRTTAQLPGYTNTNPLPNIIETLPDGTKVPVGNLIQKLPERKSSHEIPRKFQRGGAHMRPVPGREKQHSLDDISSHPSPLPGSGNTRTDALTLVPTFEEKKQDKKESAPRKSSWKWIRGGDEDKEKKSKDETESSKSKSSKLSKPAGTADKARLDVLQNSIDGTVPARGRESLVLNREDLNLDDYRKKDSGNKKLEPRKEKEKDSGLLAAIFGTKKKTSDGDLKDKKRKSDRGHSPEPPARILKPDIDYNWTRFSILEERAIYRMAHIKLANPRRALYSQVLLSNFMYSYLAKVQMMHPQMQIPAAQRAAQQKNSRSEEQQKQQQIPEYNQYQRWQEQQAREQAAQQASDSANRTSFDIVHGGGGGDQYQRGTYDDQQESSDYDRRSQEFGRQGYTSSSSTAAASSSPSSPSISTSRQDYSRSNGAGSGSGSGYSVASTHDYLGGYSSSSSLSGSAAQRSGTAPGLWDDDDEDRGEDLW